jgi:hypothetical protein
VWLGLWLWRGLPCASSTAARSVQSSGAPRAEAGGRSGRAAGSFVLPKPSSDGPLADPARPERRRCNRTRTPDHFSTSSSQYSAARWPRHSHSACPSSSSASRTDSATMPAPPAFAVPGCRLLKRPPAMHAPRNASPTHAAIEMQIRGSQRASSDVEEGTDTAGAAEAVDRAAAAARFRSRCNKTDAKAPAAAAATAAQQSRAQPNARPPSLMGTSSHAASHHTQKAGQFHCVDSRSSTRDLGQRSQSAREPVGCCGDKRCSSETPHT